MPGSVAAFGQQMLQTRTLLWRRPVQVAVGVLVATTVLSIVLAPQASAVAWDWIRLLLIAALGTGALLVFGSAPGIARGEVRQESLAGIGILVALALVLNLTFSFGTALMFSIGLTVVTLAAAMDRTERSTGTLSGVLLVVVPAWVWSALDAWTWALLLLVPLAAIAIVSDGHMRTSVSGSDIPSPLSPRGHRLGSWLGVLGGALLLLVTGLLIDASHDVVVLGAVGAMALVGIDAATPNVPASNRSIHLIDAALAWLALAWIVSL